MKQFMFLMILLLGQPIISAQEKSTQDLTPFTEVKAFDGLSVNLIKSDIDKGGHLRGKC